MDRLDWREINLLKRKQYPFEDDHVIIDRTELRIASAIQPSGYRVSSKDFWLYLIR